MGFRVGPDNQVVAEKRLHIEEGAIFCRLKPMLNRRQMLVSLGMLSMIRWETLCFIKSGAMKGVNAGTLTVACWEQTETVEALITAVIGNDSGVLDPGHYSKECLILEKSSCHIFYESSSSESYMSHFLNLYTL